jgi:hypothetical protein
MIEHKNSKRTMNYGRYIYYKTLVSNVNNLCSDFRKEMTSTWGKQICLFLRCIFNKPNIQDQQFRTSLEIVKEKILNKVQNIYSRQEGGYWPVTSGDKVFIKYMNETLGVIDRAISNIPMRDKRQKVFLNNIKRLIIRAEGEHNPKIKAAFFVQEMSVWPSLESVYEAFVSDPDCEADLVYIPFEHQNKSKFRDEIVDYKNAGWHIVHCKDYDLATKSPDFTFFLKPYDGIPIQFYITEVDKIIERSIYIPYFLNWMSIDNLDFLIKFHFQLPLHNKAWKIFDAPKYTNKSHIKYGSRNGENVEIVGHPRFDYHQEIIKFNYNIPPSWRKIIENKTVFMWNTHTPMITDKPNNRNWATFEKFGQSMLEYFKLQQKAVLLWRPHPMFFQSLIHNKLMTEKEVVTLKNNFLNSKNIILDTTSDYRYAFSIADALISDASSLLVEFLLTMKPILYTFHKVTYNLVNNSLLSAFYSAGKWDEVENFIELILNNKDEKYLIRLRLIRKEMPNYKKNIGEIVKKYCVQDMLTEEIKNSSSF